MNDVNFLKSMQKRLVDKLINRRKGIFDGQAVGHAVGQVHAIKRRVLPSGKVSFDADQLVANLATLVDAINRAKPAGAKGTYLKTLSIASTMGPGIRVDIPGVLAAAAAA